MRHTKRVVRPVVLATVAVLALLTIGQQRTTGLPNDGLYLAAAAGASALAWSGVPLLRGRERLAGALIALGVTLSSLGDFVSLAIGWQTGGEPAASLADTGWLLSYLAFASALLMLLHSARQGRGPAIDGLIDIALVFVAGMMVIWELAVAATLADDSVTMPIRVLWGLYPVLDLALLALVIRLFIRDRTGASLLLGIGVALWLFADVAYLTIADAAAYFVPLDAAWLSGMILFALAVWSGPATPRRWSAPHRATPTDEVGLGRVLLALVPLLVPAMMEVVGLLAGRHPNPAVTIGGTVLLVALVAIRMVRLAWAARAARDAVAAQQRYTAALATNSSDAVVVVNENLRLMDNFTRLAQLVGYPDRDVEGAGLMTLVAPEDQEATHAALQRSLASPGQVFEVEVRVHHGDGRQIWLGARVVNLLHDPDVRGIVVNLHNVTDRKRAEEELGHQAFHDALTGLANRALFRDRLDHALNRTERTEADPAVIFLDLDGFKTVNDSLGHDSGDDLLREVANRLGMAVRPGDTVGRLGGDEFAVLIEQSERPLDEAITVAERVLQTLRDPIQIGQRSVTVTGSAGIAVASGMIRDSSTLLRDADVAMYRSKATGKDRWTAYQPEMRTAALERLDLEAGMRDALEREEFFLVYQPVVDLRTDAVVGFEALLRWQHPTYGLLSPDRFIPIAEDNGLIVAIGRWVLHQATAAAARWQRDYHPEQPLSMAVNLSARQLTAPELVDDVTSALALSGFDPGRLVLEMTETVLVRDVAEAAARLRALHQLGVRLAIDDFGTGYSSLAYLRQFPVDILKIDRSFVSTITDRERIPSILRGLLDLGKTLQLETIAEGVELEVQRNRLRDEHCYLAQGFLFARPMPQSDVERLLSRLRVMSVAS